MPPWPTAAALFHEGEPEQAAAAAHQALDDAARPYETAAVDDVRTRAKDLAAARPTTIAA
ncbi:hypothetical protein [Streptomyces sp. JW3]|uniref:hypothetical protein n=1 Tax=Streptomyces sp. JW3 TaxID=3456955 RepID=UPI003FA4B137